VQCEEQEQINLCVHLFRNPESISYSAALISLAQCPCQVYLNRSEVEFLDDKTISVRTINDSRDSVNWSSPEKTRERVAVHVAVVAQPVFGRLLQ
jgi:hypothetical protein